MRRPADTPVANHKATAMITRPAPIRFFGTALLALALAPLPAAAQTGGTPPDAVAADRAASRPVIQGNPTATDIANTPARDLNLDHREIPAELLNAETNTYARPRGCNAAGTEVARLNALLGPDFDTQQMRGHPYSPGHIAQSVVDSLIPFGGIIKEVTGAAGKQRRLQIAVYAGFARRGYLKGVCRIRG